MGEGDARLGVDLPAETAFGIDSLTPAADAELLKRRSVRGAAATFLGQGTRFVLQFGAQVALARLLLPAQFGLVAMVGPVLSFVAIFNELGLTQATVQRARISHQELSNLFWINFAVSLVLAGCMAAASPLVASFYAEPRLVPVTLALAGLLVVSGLSSQPIALMNRTMRFGRLAVIDVACTTLTAAVRHRRGVCGVRLLVPGDHAGGQRGDHPGALLDLRALAAGPAAPRGGTKRAAALRRQHGRAYNLVNFAGNNVDLVMIGKVGGTLAVGLYDRGFKLVAAPIWTISLPVARVAVSLLSRLNGSPAQYRRAFPADAAGAAADHRASGRLHCGQRADACGLPAGAGLGAGGSDRRLAGDRHRLRAAQHFRVLAVPSARTAPASRCATPCCVRRSPSRPCYAGCSCWRRAPCWAGAAAGGAGAAGGALGVARAYGGFGVLVHGLPLWGAVRADAAGAARPVTPRDVLRSLLPFVLAGVAVWCAVAACEARLADAGLAAFAASGGLRRACLRGRRGQSTGASGRAAPAAGFLGPARRAVSARVAKSG